MRSGAAGRKMPARGPSRPLDVLLLLLALVPLAVLVAVVRLARPLEAGERALLAAATCLFAASAVLSPHAPVHDQWTHFVHVRAALSDPIRLLDLWDRPGFTLFYAAPAGLGLTAARLASVVLAALAFVATVHAGRALGVARPWTAGLLLVAQQDFAGQAASTMTELPAAAAMAIALWGWAERRPWLAAAGLGWLSITRPEGPVFAALGAAALLARHRRLAPAVLAVAPFAAYLAAGAVAFRDPLWWIHGNPYRGMVGARLSLRAVADTFFFEALRRGQPRLLIALEALGVALVVAGRAPRLRVLLAPVAISFLLLTFLQIGPSATWLDSRYLVTVAPALALLACGGLDGALAAFPRAAPPVLLAAAGASAWWQLSWFWRGMGLAPWAGLVALAALAAAGALLAAARATPRGAIAGLLLLPMAAAPPGALARQRGDVATEGDDGAAR